MVSVRDSLLSNKLNLTSSEYHAHPAVGSSSLKRILRSPAHYKYELENPSEPTPAMQFGTIAHEAILEPHLFEQSTVVMPTFSGTGSRAAKEQWCLENHGKRLLSADQMVQVKGMLRSIENHTTARALLKNGSAEQSYFDECPETGIARKVRPDYLREGRIIVDVKTTQDASPQAFSKAVANFKYDLSAALYLDVVSSALSQTFDKFLIIAVEKDPPYAVAVYLLDEKTIQVGRGLYRRALQILSECRASGRFPAYADHVQTLALPTWAFNQE